MWKNESSWHLASLNFSELILLASHAEAIKMETTHSRPTEGLLQAEFPIETSAIGAGGSRSGSVENLGWSLVAEK